MFLELYGSPPILCSKCGIMQRKLLDFSLIIQIWGNDDWPDQKTCYPSQWLSSYGVHPIASDMPKHGSEAKDKEIHTLDEWSLLMKNKCIF